MEKPISSARLAKKLGYKSTRAIQMILKGDRFPNSTSLELLIKELALSGTQSRYIQQILLRDKLKGKNRDLEKVLQESMDRQSTLEVLKDDEMEMVANWYSFVLYQLLFTKEFKTNVSWIRKRLRNKVSAEEIEQGLNRLIRLGYATIDSQTREIIPVEFRTTRTLNTSSLVRKKYHNQMLNLAMDSLSEQDTDERELQSLCLAVDSTDLPASKVMIREFVEEFSARFGRDKGKADSVYQFNMQFFEHTVSNKKKAIL